MIADKPNAPRSGNYTVGKGRPPLSTRWKPGQSGNPKGRPRGAKQKDMAIHFHEALRRKIEITVDGKSRKVTVREAIALKVTNLALKGDPKAISLIIAKEPEIAAAVQRLEKLDFSKMTALEASEAFERVLRGEQFDLT
jgi:hypothetical protein